MKKKTIALLLSATLLAGTMFAGCSNGDQTGDQQSTTETATSGTEAATTETSIYDMTREDLEGRKITLTTAEDWWNDAYQDMVDRYCEEFGVEIEVNILPASTASEVIKAQFATNELADITMN